MFFLGASWLLHFTCNTYNRVTCSVIQQTTNNLYVYAKVKRNTISIINIHA